MASRAVTRRLVLRLAPVLLAAILSPLTVGSVDLSWAKARSSAKPAPEKRTGLRPGQQLAAMRAAIAAAPRSFAGYQTTCARTVPVITYVRGQTMAGNFRDQSGGCYIWLNLEYSPDLNAQEICKLALHESGHLGGLQHSSDPEDVMYSPFESQPVPAPCSTPLS
jgi:Matrixin